MYMNAMQRRGDSFQFVLFVLEMLQLLPQQVSKLLWVALGNVTVRRHSLCPLNSSLITTISLSSRHQQQTDKQHATTNTCQNISSYFYLKYSKQTTDCAEMMLVGVDKIVLILSLMHIPHI